MHDPGGSSNLPDSTMPYADPDKQREYGRLWRAKRHDDWFAENGPCIDCGSWDDLQIDHLDPKQKVSHKVWSWTKVRMDEELTKCVVRCSPCHRKKGQVEGDYGAGSRRISTENVAEIRQRYADGNISQKQLGVEFNCGRTTIGDIVRGDTRKYL